MISVRFGCEPNGIIMLNKVSQEISSDSELFAILARARQGKCDIEAASLAADEASATAADAAALAAALDAYDVALAAVLDAPAATLCGMRAKLRWLADNSEDLTAEHVGRFARSLVDSLESGGLGFIPSRERSLLGTPARRGA